VDQFDLLIIGGGINGAAIARDAAGRGLSVLLVERDDLASHTSSASSKLIHGGLRYLETYEFRLVRESLQEREVLLRTAPHVVRPLRFILPHPEGGRPWWMIRAGLMLYGLLAGRASVARPGGVPRGDAGVRGPLKEAGRLAQYWDAWVDDARLVVLNAVAAAMRGAQIATRTELLSARREGDHWLAELSGGRTVQAGMIVNAAGPWVAQVLGQRLGESSDAGVRLIKGTHIVVPRLYEGEHAYILQADDGRVVFALPYGDLNLIGTTDTPVERPEDARVEPSEVAYLCAAANAYFKRQTGPQDVRWSYAGIRSLYDNGAGAAKDVTRDYRLELEQAEGAKLLSVFGGKITTARALASEALDKLGVGGLKFTRTSALPGGDLTSDFNAWLEEIGGWMPQPMLMRMAQAYGTRLRRLIEDAASLGDLGRHFGADLYAAEVDFLVENEFARTAEDILWRRTKLGLRLSEQEQRGLAAYLAQSDKAPSRSTAGRRTIGWLVDEAQRVELLQQFGPVYPNIVAHHVTLATGAGGPLPQPVIGEIVGIADDSSGVQALVVTIDGTSDRPGGGTFHITWSLADGRQARESNDVIAEHGWTRIELPVPVTLHPTEL
jgi:glycerol-3-phosphate dehydrogenase